MFGGFLAADFHSHLSHAGLALTNYMMIDMNKQAKMMTII
jgi:hypothetical protein